MDAIVDNNTLLSQDVLSIMSHCTQTPPPEYLQVLTLCTSYQVGTIKSATTLNLTKNRMTSQLQGPLISNFSCDTKLFNTFNAFILIRS